MKKLVHIFGAAALLFCGLLAGPAHAAPVTIGFEGVVADGQQTACPMGPYVESGFTLTPSPGNVCNAYILNNGAGNNGFGNTTSVMAICAGCPLVMTLTAADPFSALSIDIGSYYGSDPAPITFTGFFVGGGSITQILDGATRWDTYLFTGFNNLSSLRIETDNSGQHASIDNIVLDAGTRTVPEPASIALVGLALVAVGAARRRKAA